MSHLDGRCAIITGASQGLGKAIAEHYVGAGASVLLCARSGDAIKAVRDELAAQASVGQKVLSIACDVAKGSDVDELFAMADASFPSLEILVNNAGIYGPIGPAEDVDWREWVEAIEINLMGTVYPCRLATSRFKERGYGKVINISGGGATAPLPRISAYAASKAAVVRFTETLAEELKSHRVDVNAVAPGALNTRMMQQVIEAGPEKVGDAFYNRMKRISAEGGTPLAVGARCCVYLGSAESDGITGKLIAAQWDPWADLQTHAADLNGTDIYTLRRIVPKDRGKAWGDA